MEGVAAGGRRKRGLMAFFINALRPHDGRLAICDWGDKQEKMLKKPKQRNNNTESSIPVRMCRDTSHHHRANCQQTDCWLLVLCGRPSWPSVDEAGHVIYSTKVASYRIQHNPLDLCSRVYRRCQDETLNFILKALFFPPSHFLLN